MTDDVTWLQEVKVVTPKYLCFSVFMAVESRRFIIDHQHKNFCWQKLHISDKENYGCSKFQFCPKFSQNNRFLIPIFMRESSYCFQRVLAIAILSVCLSDTRVDQAKTVKAKITKSSPSAAWKTLVSGTVKLFYKFKGVYFKRGH